MVLITIYDFPCTILTSTRIYQSSVCVMYRKYIYSHQPVCVPSVKWTSLCNKCRLPKCRLPECRLPKSMCPIRPDFNNSKKKLKCNVWQMFYNKCNYGKSIMTNETEPVDVVEPRLFLYAGSGWRQAV